MGSKNITTELICKKSLEIINEEGLDKLSMRNLAAKLGIKAPSLYVHIKNKAGLILMLQAYAFNSNHLMGTLNPDANTCWQEYLLTIMTKMRAFFLTNPPLFELFATYESASEESRATFEKYLTKMQDYGFNLQDAAYIGRVIRMFVIGHVEFESKAIINNKSHPLLPANILDEFVHTKNFFTRFGGYNYEQSFIFGAKILISGCKSLINV